MPRLFTKILLSFFASLVILLSFAPFFEAKAAPNNPPPPKDNPAPVEGSWYNQGFGQWYGKVYDDKNPSEIFGERYTAAQVQWVVYSLMSFILNSSLGNSSESQKAVHCFLTNSGDVNSCVDSLKTLISIVPGSNIALIPETPKQNLLSLVFNTNRPLSGMRYVREKVQNFSIIPVANAQTPGFGFSTALQPIQAMWKGVRDISFGLFVIVAVVFAFMIMFRVKLSPQVVISVQSALPKIIVSLILVTFSYAIAGFLIDLMYVVIGIVSVMFSSMIPGFTSSNIFNFLTVGQPAGYSINLGFLLLGVLYLVLFIISFIFLGALFLGAMGTVAAGAGIAVLVSVVSATGIGGLILLILAVVIIVVVAWHLIKITFSLIKAFATVLLLTIAAPIQITLGTFIPNFGFSSWMKSYISALSTFVVVGILTLLSYVFLLQAWAVGFSTYAPGIGEGLVKWIFGTALPGSSFVANNQGSWPPLLGGGAGANLGLLFLGVSFVLFTMIPKATEVVQAFMAGKPFNYGSAIGEALGPIKASAKFGLSSYGSSQMEIGEGVYKGGNEEMGKKIIRRGALIKEASSFLK